MKNMKKKWIIILFVLLCVAITVCIISIEKGVSSHSTKAQGNATQSPGGNQIEEGKQNGVEAQESSQDKIDQETSTPDSIDQEDIEKEKELDLKAEPQEDVEEYTEEPIELPFVPIS